MRTVFAIIVASLMVMVANGQKINSCGYTNHKQFNLDSLLTVVSLNICDAKSNDHKVTVISAQPSIANINTVRPTFTLPPILISEASSTGQSHIGINASAGNYFSHERIWANLAYRGSEWFQQDPADTFRADGYPNRGGRIFLNIPQSVFTGTPTKVTCTWKGAGKIFMDGDRTEQWYGDHTAWVVWKRHTPEDPGGIFLNFSQGNPADPFRDLDCREDGVVQNGVFDQRYIDDMKPYSVIRFLDWSVANSNTPVTWATRSLPGGAPGSDGVPAEHQVDLANLTGADVWFTIPWNADETYVRNFAAMVRDRLAPTSRAYFELGNEVWNFGFPVATQALNEGLAENLDADKYSNNLLRYAEKSIWMHKLLTVAFRETPNRLVRVIGVQSGNTWGLEKILTFRDTAKWVDAVASAPYFGRDMLREGTANTDSIATRFATLEVSRQASNDQAAQLKAMATRYGLRSIVYETGQHIVPTDPNAAAAAEMQRSPLMGEAYDRHLADLKRIVGDTIMVYSATGSISKYGAWGIREYAGQPLFETPKRRAVLDAIGKR